MDTVLALGLLLAVPQEVDWVGSHDKGLEVARRTGQPVLIYLFCS